MERTTEINSVLWIGTAVMLFFALGLIFLVLFYQNYFSRMKRREAEQLLLVALESEKHERKRIAADLHDSVSGDLVAIRNYLMVMEKTGNGSMDQSIFDELKQGVENALENTRQVSYKLMPPLLDTFGLGSAVSEYFERLTQKTKVSFSVTRDDQPELSAEIAYELFRIIQELTTNMLKYGSVTQCTVGIHQSNLATIEITDDGKTFDFKQSLHAAKGTGLKNIDSRLRVIGAALDQRTEEQGNHFVITFKQNKYQC